MSKLNNVNQPIARRSHPYSIEEVRPIEWAHTHLTELDLGNG